MRVYTYMTRKKKICDKKSEKKFRPNASKAEFKQFTS